MPVNIGPRIGIEGEAEYRKSIQNIIQQQKTLKAEMLETASAFGKDATEKDKNKAKTEQLTRAVEIQKKRVDELQRMVDQSADKYGEADTKTLKWKEALAAAKAELNRLERELSESNSKLRQLGDAAKAAGDKLKSIGNKVADIGKDLTTKVTAPMVAGATVATKKFADVDKTMQLVKGTMGEVKFAAGDLDQAMKEAAANSTFGMSDAATASLNFARAGLDAQQAADALAPAMNLAAGEGGELDIVSGGLVATINGFHGAFSEASHYADVFSNACNNSALDINSLSEAMSIAAPIFSSAGYQVEDAALYMGVMANNGIDANKAATSLKTGLARLVAPAKQGADMMDMLGISVTNADGSMKDSLTIQRELHDTFAELSESEQLAAASAIFGKNQMAPWLALIGTAPKDVEKLSSALAQEGTTTEMAESMMSGFGGSIEKLKSSLDVLAVSVGELVAKHITPFVDKIQALVDKFNSLDAAQQDQIVQIGAVIAAVGPALLIVGKVTAAIGTVISTVGSLATSIAAAGGLIPAIGALAAAAAPFLIGGAIIAGVVAAGVLIVKNWDKIKAAAGKFKDGIARAFANAKNAVAGAFTAIKNTASNVWNGIKITISNAVSAIYTNVTNRFSAIKTAASNTFNAIKTAITQPIERARVAIKTQIDKIKGLFNFKVSLPRIKLPHFSWTWWEVGDLLKVPNISVKWYKRAYDNPVMFNSPTVLGTSSGYKGFGDSTGGEIVIGRNTMMDMIREAVGSGGGDINVVINAAPGQDVRELADLVADRINSKVMRRRMAFGY